MYTCAHTHTPHRLTDAQGKVSLVPDVEVEQQVCVQLLQEVEILLIGHLLNQQLYSNQHTHVHQKSRQLHKHAHTEDYDIKY